MDPYNNNYPQQPLYSNHQKLFSILSYIGILWLFGLLVTPERYDARVRFHVGQGMVLTIANVCLSVILRVLNALISALSITILGSFAGLLLTAILSLTVAVCTIGWMVDGIVQVCTGSDKPLPLIGKYAFFR